MIIETVPQDLMKRQIDMELKMIHTGVERYRKNFNNRKVNSGLGTHESGQALIKSVLNPYIDGISKWIEENRGCTDRRRERINELIEDIDPERIAYIAILHVVNGIANNVKLVALSVKIAQELELELRLRVWLEEDKQTAKRIIDKANKKATERHKKKGLIHKLNTDQTFNPNWSLDDKAKLGIKLIDILITTTGIVEIVNQTLSGLKTVAVVRAATGTFEWIEKFNANREASRPRWSPHLVKPKEWTDVYGGGFHNTVLKPLCVVKGY